MPNLRSTPNTIISFFVYISRLKKIRIFFTLAHTHCAHCSFFLFLHFATSQISLTSSP